jgi:hypothetical protein
MLQSRFSFKIISLFIFVSLIIGCAVPEPLPVISFMPDTPEEIQRAREIWKKVDERNRTIEKDPEWIKESYNEIKVKPLNTLPTYRYAEYNKFLDNGTVYIINHPGFYTFFQHPRIKRKDNQMAYNMMDIFLSKSAENSSGKGSKSRYEEKVINAMREFERIQRNFLEFKSTEQKLVIIILPGSYGKYASYTYKNEDDEYARFINDVTNQSDSVFYLESRKANRGQLSDDDLNTLTEFLTKVGAKSVLIGGEYVGRCQEDFYKQLIDVIGSKIAIETVPELSPPSPDDMNTKMMDLLGPNGKLDIQAATFNIMKNKYDNIDTTPKLRNLRTRLFYESPDSKN